MKRKLLIILLVALACNGVYAGEPVITLDSIISRDPYLDLYKSERYTYDDDQRVLKYIKWDNTGDNLKQDSTFYRYDAQGNMTFREKWAYPRTSKYLGWKGSTRDENEYYPDGKLYKEKSWSYFQPNADAEGEWYANAGYTYTYYDDGKIHSKLMASGGYGDGAPKPYADKVMYVYTYDDQGRITLEENFKKNTSGEWKEISGRKTNEYSKDNIKDASLEFYENFENGEWIPSSKTEREFSNLDSLSCITYWSYDKDLKSWKGSSKTVYSLDATGKATEYVEYGWTDGEWKEKKKTVYTYDDQGRKIRYHVWDIQSDGSTKDYSETEYGYDDRGRYNMSAYYSYTSGAKKGTSKSFSTFNDKDQIVEKITYQWSSYDNKWEDKTKIETEYNENEDIASQKESYFDGFSYNDKYVHTYYYTAHNTGGVSESGTDTMNFKLIVQSGFIQVDVPDGIPVSFYDLNGKLIKDNSKVCSSLSTGAYIVRVGANSVKVLVP